jgi:hypothetical protein
MFLHNGGTHLRASMLFEVNSSSIRVKRPFTNCPASHPSSAAAFGSGSGDRQFHDLSKKAHFQCCWCGVLSRRLLTCHLHGESSCFLARLLCHQKPLRCFVIGWRWPSPAILTRSCLLAKRGGLSGDQSWEEMMIGFTWIAIDPTTDVNQLFVHPEKVEQKIAQGEVERKAGAAWFLGAGWMCAPSSFPELSHDILPGELITPSRCVSGCRVGLVQKRHRPVLWPASSF